MSRVMRRIVLTAGVVLALVVLAAAALPFLIDVNRYRPLIVAKVREATGRTLSVGTVSFSLLPAPALSVGGPINLSDSSKYPGRNALTAESLSVRIGLMGLLRGRANVTSIILHRPTLTLIRDARGKWNFDDLVEKAASAPASRPVDSGGGSFRVLVERARIEGGRLLVYDDAVLPGRRAEIAIAPVAATIRGWGGDDPTELDLTAGLGKSRLEAQARLSGRAADSRLSMIANGKGLRAEDFVGLLPWLGVARPAGLQVSGSIDLNGTADLPVEHPEALRFKGVVSLDGVSYRDAGMAFPVKSLSGKLTVDGERAVWEKFKVEIGSSAIQGRLQVEDFLHPRVGFTLTSPRLDLNQIVATLMPQAPARGASVPAASASGSSGLLDQVSGTGRIEVGQVRFQTFDLSSVKASMSLAGSIFSLKDLGAAFYDGTLKGSASVDVSRAVPRYSAAVRLDNVDVGPLLAAYDQGLKDLVRGRFHGDLGLGASGSDMNVILRTAEGQGTVRIVDGSVASFSLLKQLAGLLELAGGKGIGKESTPFESLTAGLTIKDGRARTEDLSLHSPDLDLEGRGWIGLDATFDLDVTARFSEASTSGMVAKNARLGSLTEGGRLPVYFTLKGDLATPVFRLNSRAQVQTAKERAKDKLRERVRDSLLRRLGGATPEPEPTPSPTPQQP
jgi:AsmA protein